MDCLKLFEELKRNTIELRFETAKSGLPKGASNFGVTIYLKTAVCIMVFCIFRPIRYIIPVPERYGKFRQPVILFSSGAISQRIRLTMMK